MVKTPKRAGQNFDLAVAAVTRESMGVTHPCFKGWSLPYAPYQQLRPGILTPYTKEGVESPHFPPYIVGSKDKCVHSQQSSADFQSHFATVKMTVKIFDPGLNC